MTYPAKHISININKDPKVVYEFASEPLNMPKWAAGLSGSIKKEGDHWISASPMGKVKVKFTPKNDLGVIDHDVYLNNKIYHNPFRVLKNGEDSEVVFTLYRQPEMNEQEFSRDAEMVMKDLNKLKELIEKE